MPSGFLHASSVFSTKHRTSTLPKCGACGIYKTCKSPKIGVSGEGRLKTLVVAEAPDVEEDERGVHLIGKAGQELRKFLRHIDVDLDEDCWMTSSLICRPPNRQPTDDEIEYCRPNLLNTIEELKPEKIILLGAAPIESLIGYLWKEKTGQVGRWVGWKIPSQELNAWICPTYLPSYIMREKNEVLNLWFAKHLKEAFELKERPWKETPDYSSEVERIYEADEAARIIRSYKEYDGRAAFDFETNSLKPDKDDSNLICCSIAWGREDVERCISFPVVGEAREALGRFLRSPVKKIGWNIQFEDRWSRKFYGHRVRNWTWDGMNAAHVLDNRAGITGLKFQAFVKLGVGNYSEHVTTQMKEDSVTSSQIFREISVEDLLLYCGLDSLLEFKIAAIQKKEIDEFIGA